MNKKLQDLLGAIEGSIERQFKTGAYPPNIPEHSIQLLKSDIVQWIRTDKTLHKSLFWEFGEVLEDDETSNYDPLKVNPILGSGTSKPPIERTEEEKPLDQMSQEGRDNYFYNLGVKVAIANSNVWNKRYEQALDYIALVAMKKDHHLGRPRSSDTECIFCLAYLALNDGAYGESFNYKALAEEMRKRPPFTATDTV